MSEKPFWEGKTCEEMAGLPVKAVFKNGVTITGQLSRFGGIPISTEGMNSPIPISSNTLNFRPHREISSVELLDSLEYERIDNIEDVREGDIFVAKDLNRYSVCSVLRKEHGEDNIIQVHVVGVGQFAILRSAFSYALRPKPQLPNHGGPWLDKNWKTWIVSDKAEHVYKSNTLMQEAYIAGASRQHTDEEIRAACLAIMPYVISQPSQQVFDFLTKATGAYPGQEIVRKVIEAMQRKATEE